MRYKNQIKKYYQFKLKIKTTVFTSDTRVNMAMSRDVTVTVKWNMETDIEGRHLSEYRL